MTQEVASTAYDGNATATVYTGKSKVYTVVLTPAAAVATLVLQDGGAGGIVKARLQAAASGASVPLVLPAPFQCNTDIYITLTGAGATYNVYHRPNG